MKKELFISIFFVFHFYLLKAQSIGDTSIYIQPVVVEATKSGETPGMSIIKIDSSFHNIYKTGSVADLLSAQSPVNIRNYGAGLLSTVNARGLGSNHTSLLWNGIPLNSPNLGLTDLSLLPSHLFDEISVISGSTGPVYGNNSLGVAIELLNKEEKENSLNFSGTRGSYGCMGNSIQLNYLINKLYTSTNLYAYEADNDFPYKNITKRNFPIEKQKNALQKQMGIMEVVSYKIDKHNRIKAGLWYQYSQRELPPLMLVSLGEESQRDSSLRIFLDYAKLYKSIGFNNIFSYSREFIFYNNLINNITGRSDVKIFRNETEIKYYPFNSLVVSSSFIIKNSLAAISEYGEEKTNYSQSVKITSRYKLNNWNVGAGIQKEFNDLFEVPITYSAGVDRNFLVNKLNISAGLSKIYSLPTLNDVYWKPGGNLNLKSEEGLTTQINIKYNHYKNSFISLTGYWVQVNNWIQWTPDNSGLYTPDNIKEVESKGIEFHYKQFVKINYWFAIMSGSYSFIHPVNKKFTNNFELENKKLIYVPQNSFNLNILIYYKNISIYTNMEYTGERFTTADNTAVLEPYSLVKLGGLINLNHDRFLFTVKPEIRNLFNVSYQPIPWRAMPGRSYFLTLSLNLNLDKTSNNEK